MPPLLCVCVFFLQSILWRFNFQYDSSLMIYLFPNRHYVFLIFFPAVLLVFRYFFPIHGHQLHSFQLHDDFYQCDDSFLKWSATWTRYYTSGSNCESIVCVNFWSLFLFIFHSPLQSFLIRLIALCELFSTSYFSSVFHYYSMKMIPIKCSLILFFFNSQFYLIGKWLFRQIWNRIKEANFSLKKKSKNKRIPLIYWFINVLTPMHNYIRSGLFLFQISFQNVPPFAKKKENADS